MSRLIPIIDIFAGPGGLGEGFASFRDSSGRARFDIRLSIEKDAWAAETLRLRALSRRIPDRISASVPKLLEEGLTAGQVGALLDDSGGAGTEVRREVWHQTLSREHSDLIRGRVRGQLGDPSAWVLIGGPPCQAYSLIGRARNRGVVSYVPELDERQTLYVEYLQIIADHVPAVFVMENVKGLLSAKLESRRMFDRILDDLRDPAVALKREGRSSCEAVGPAIELCP